MSTRSASRLVCYLSAICVLALAPAILADEPVGTVAERLAKVRSELKSDDVEIRRKAIGSLVHSDLSEMLATEMWAALKDPDSKVREVAATATGNLGAKSVPAIPMLVEQLQNDPVKESRETAARALGRIGKAAPGENSAIGPLEIAAKEDKDPVTRVVSHGALAQMNIHLKNQIAELRKYLQHEEALVRMKAAHALGMIGNPAKAASPEIVKVLQQETDHHRLGYVARALGNVGDPAALPALQAALAKETDSGAKGEIQGAIQRLGGKIP